MEVSAKLSNLRTAPRKVRLVADLVRGKGVFQAQSILSFTVNKSSRSILKLLNSAIASAKHDFHLDESNLFISKITVDEGPKLKRWHPMSRGRAYTILKRTSHIALVLGEINAKKEANQVEARQEEKIETPVVAKTTKGTKKAPAKAKAEAKPKKTAAKTRKTTKK
jgi:large subunit ribosomal protein L22